MLCPSGEHGSDEEDINCTCGIRVGALEQRNGILCSVDARERNMYRAPRGSDVALAQRIVAAVKAADDDVSHQLVQNITGIREGS